MKLHRPDTPSERVAVMLRHMLPSADPLRPPTEPALDATPPVSGVATTDRRRRTWGRMALITAALVATFVVGIGIGRFGALPPAGESPIPGASAGAGSADELALIVEAWDTIHRQYVDRANLDDRALAYAAIDGLAEAVGDTGHTSFLTPEELAARHDDLSGSYVGIGVRIDPAEDGRPLVVGVFDDSPAAKAGVKVGDIIESVDGTTTTGTDIDTVAGLIRGEADTTVTITVRAGTTGPSREYTITRAAVPIEAVSWAMVPGSRTALLRLDSFSAGSADEVIAALKALQEAGAERLVLDLRGNPGGYVNEAVDIASQFIASGDVYIERDANGKETRHAVTGSGIALDLPLVVLVDGGTASSAEILSGALQDAKRATIVGVTTFGTGTVLGEFGLQDGSALRIGTVEWLTPDGRRIWHAGIEPDDTVERATDVAAITPDEIRDLTAAEVGAIKDPQLARALTVVATAP